VEHAETLRREAHGAECRGGGAHYLIEQLTMTGSRGRLAMATDRLRADATESRAGIVNRFDQGDVEHAETSRAKHTAPSAEAEECSI